MLSLVAFFTLAVSPSDLPAAQRSTLPRPPQAMLPVRDDTPAPRPPKPQPYRPVTIYRPTVHLSHRPVARPVSRSVLSSRSCLCTSSCTCGCVQGLPCQCRSFVVRPQAAMSGDLSSCHHPGPAPIQMTPDYGWRTVTQPSHQMHHQPSFGMQYAQPSFMPRPSFVGAGCGPSG